MLVEQSIKPSTKEGGADGAVLVIYDVGDGVSRDRGGLTSSHCGGCHVIFCSSSSSQTGSDSDKILSSLLQTSQCV